MNGICSSAYILIAFSDTISLSADILIAPAHSLIVMEHTIKESEEEVYLLLPISYFFVVTSSRCRNCVVTIWKSVCCVRDNSVTTKNEMGFVVTHISVCLPVCFPRCDNVTTKNGFFLVEEICPFLIIYTLINVSVCHFEKSCIFAKEWI